MRRIFSQCINPLPTNIPNHTETSQLIFNVNQLTGFYMMANIGREWNKATEDSKYVLFLKSEDVK